MSINPVCKRPLEKPQLPDAKKRECEPLSILAFPEEIILNIFNFLSIRELGRMSLVCKTWQRISNTPYFWQGHYNSLVRNKTYKPWKELQNAVIQSSAENRKKCVQEWIKGPYQENVWDMTALENELFSGTTAMGLAMTSFLKKDWEQIVTSDIKIPDEPQLDPRSTLTRMYEFQKIVQGPFTRMMIPQDFDFKNIMNESRFNLSTSNTNPAGDYKYFSMRAPLGFEFWCVSPAIKNTMIVLIGHNILPDSVNKTMEEQQQMLTKLGCEMPTATIVATLLFLHLKGNVTYQALGYKDPTAGYQENYAAQATRSISSFHSNSCVFTECHRRGEECQDEEDAWFDGHQFTINVEPREKRDPNLGVLPMMILYP